MKSKTKSIYILMCLCVIWFCISIITYQYSRSINILFANIIINPIGTILLIKFIKNDKLKLLISIYFFIYGFVFFIYDSYIMLHIRNIIEFDTIYLLSDVTMMYVSIKMYNINIINIIKKLVYKLWNLMTKFT